jgi:hypothetical protein
MSLYVEWLNLIKLKADNSWLTISQAPVYNAILTNWMNQPFINLYGAHGSGKSFIARLLSSKNQYTYSSSLEEVPEGSTNIVIDDASYSRSMRTIARERQLTRIILITVLQITEAMPHVELMLTEKDREQFVAGVGKNCQIFFNNSIPEGTDLNQILIRELRNRGEGRNEH